MPPRPHPFVLASLVAGCAIVVLLVMPGRVAGASWAWPLRGPLVGTFHVSPGTPFARGQRRGIDVSAAPGALVRAACPGLVTFAGPLPRHGLALSVRCGALVATYLGLERLAVRAGARVTRGQRLAALGVAGRLRLGARRAGDRRGYVDPLALLGDERPAPPRLGPAPRALLPRRVVPLRPSPPPFVAPAVSARPHGLPWPAYPALALAASALPVGGVVRRRRRAARTPALARAPSSSA